MTFHRPKKELGFEYSQEDYECVLSLHTRKSMESVKEEVSTEESFQIKEEVNDLGAPVIKEELPEIKVCVNIKPEEVPLDEKSHDQNKEISPRSLDCTHHTFKEESDTEEVDTKISLIKEDFKTCESVSSQQTPWWLTEDIRNFKKRRNMMKDQTNQERSKQYICCECGKTFIYLSGLKLHQNSHTGNKPHSCTVCGKSFTRISALKSHQRIHTGEKPYSCAECGKCFSHSFSLASHQRTHNGEERYKCVESGRLFSPTFDLDTNHRIRICRSLSSTLSEPSPETWMSL
ncbi:putative zinc finger protein 286B [Erpetoichthys calabaricus]|uniref:putative zinc finger protein 286B n=1 Tax=Erpetoichthys calabaricus TaxID=27687 RepID=UPI00223476B3|nr:putative zinc finger protein 286B [Erpetoichthys calabaricus]XP_051790429.1 putative zinc finger protein 286B [Erpetoichthys calabaricus]